ncbi:hypothetical protein [Halalkalibacter nanhaiisediminis]|uniref:Lipoprotein n=1 Tax=Halalkalibacter nanhaiisediminis TaxID=688079 RepID=A0A562Q898_9BACI|nr:hypothetical protein [Halalkalibacter nanhaiisediminis]TWI52959.1 hypothetical protein IQ10_03568 [Halalkalibacter nanhaiisediminis]
MEKRVCYLILCFSFLILVGCNNNISGEEIATINEIDIELNELEGSVNGEHVNFQLKNNSDGNIIINNIFISNPIEVNDSSKENQYQVQIGGINYQKINAGENEYFSGYLPDEGRTKGDEINRDKVQIKVEGYLESVKEGNEFSIITIK